MPKPGSLPRRRCRGTRCPCRSRRTPSGSGTRRRTHSGVSSPSSSHGASVSDTVLFSMTQLLPLASTAESALFSPDVPDAAEDVAAHGARVGALLEVGALGSDVLEHVVLDRAPARCCRPRRRPRRDRCTRSPTSSSSPSRRRRPRRTAGCCDRCRGPTSHAARRRWSTCGSARPRHRCRRPRPRRSPCRPSRRARCPSIAWATVMPSMCQ